MTSGVTRSSVSAAGATGEHLRLHLPRSAGHLQQPFPDAAGRAGRVLRAVPLVGNPMRSIPRAIREGAAAARANVR